MERISLKGPGLVVGVTEVDGCDRLAVLPLDPHDALLQSIAVAITEQEGYQPPRVNLLAGQENWWYGCDPVIGPPGLKWKLINAYNWTRGTLWVKWHWFKIWLKERFK